MTRQISGVLDISALDDPYVAVVHLASVPNPHVLQQVCIRKDKVSPGGLIRFGETPGDEALCWIRPDSVEIIEVLGRAEITETGVKVTPFDEPMEVAA